LRVLIILIIDNVPLNFIAITLIGLYIFRVRKISKKIKISYNQIGSFNERGSYGTPGGNNPKGNNKIVKFLNKYKSNIIKIIINAFIMTIISFIIRYIILSMYGLDIFNILDNISISFISFLSINSIRLIIITMLENYFNYPLTLAMDNPEAGSSSNPGAGPSSNPVYVYVPGSGSGSGSRSGSGSGSGSESVSQPNLTPNNPNFWEQPLSQFHEWWRNSLDWSTSKTNQYFSSLPNLSSINYDNMTKEQKKTLFYQIIDRNNHERTYCLTSYRRMGREMDKIENLLEGSDKEEALKMREFMKNRFKEARWELNNVNKTNSWESKLIQQEKSFNIYIDDYNHAILLRGIYIFKYDNMIEKEAKINDLLRNNDELMKSFLRIKHNNMQLRNLKDSLSSK